MRRVVKNTSSLSMVKWARQRPKLSKVSLGLRSVDLYCFCPSYLAVWCVQGFFSSKVKRGKPLTNSTMSISRPGLATENVCWRVSENWFWVYFSFEASLSAAEGLG